MTIATSRAGEDQERYAGQIYQEQHARLRRYFLRQLCDGREAEACVQETMRHLFFFMEDRDWAEEAEYVPVYLMRIAGQVCSRRLAAARRRRAGQNQPDSLLDQIRKEAIRSIKERVEFRRFALGPLVGDGRQPSRAMTY